MMNNNSNDIILDFWYKFDNFFLFKATQEIRDALGKIKPYGHLLNTFYYHQQHNTISSGGYKKDLENEEMREDIKTIAEHQLRIIDESFQNNPDIETKAFELFGQGLLFDNKLDSNGLPRRPRGTKIHMMDSDITGFVAWHAFVRAAVVLEVTGTVDRWLKFDRQIALAAAILSSLFNEGKRPQQTDNPNQNQPLNESIILQLKNYWMSKSFEEIDDKITKLEEMSITTHL